MKYLFIHKHLPGQFEHLISSLLEDPDNEVIAVGQNYIPQHHTLMGLRVECYDPAPVAQAPIHACLNGCAEQIANGLTVAGLLDRLQREGFVPDVSFTHLGWGEATYLRDIYPSTRWVGYCEFYYHAKGVDADFDPAFPISQHDVYRIRSANAVALLSLTGMDIGISPTQWQRSLFPVEFQDKIKVLHEGIPTHRFRPDATATFRLPNGRMLTREDKVVTYATRNLEPYRGFHILARAIARLCRMRPDCHVVIAGGDEVAYSARLSGSTYRDVVMAECPLDLARVHFVGKLAYGEYLKLLQISSAHVYLTVPFVLSWSLLEAMAIGCPIVASDTAPVREVIRHEVNGLLADFFSPHEIARKIDRLLTHPTEAGNLGARARQTALEGYDAMESLQRYRSLIAHLTADGGHPV